MSYQIKLDVEAQEDVQAVIDWYNKKQDYLGNQFFEELNELVHLLKLNPKFEIIYSTVRCLPLKKFPFNIHFTIDEANKVVNILAVFHTSLNPEYWRTNK